MVTEKGRKPHLGEGNSPKDQLLEVQELSKRFEVSKNFFRKASGFIHAVDGVSFSIAEGESLGVVGESGCGKTTIGKLLVKLLEPDGGRVHFRLPTSPTGAGEAEFVDISSLMGKQVRRFRRHVQMIFQDPYESMNPRRTVYDIVSEPMSVQKIGNVIDRVDRVSEILGLVGLAPASSFLLRHPHELSGGQRQRVAIARALVIRPKFVVADEPTSMLDVSSRTGIIQLMQQLREHLGVSYLYVTHDLAVARYMCDRVGVMYSGKSSNWQKQRSYCATPFIRTPGLCFQQYRTWPPTGTLPTFSATSPCP